MTISPIVRRAAAVCFAAAMTALLAACLVLPGKFEANLDLRKDGRFTYTYKGEVVVLGLTRMAEMVMAAKEKKAFEPSPCHKKNGVTERPCTKAETDQQKVDWDAQQQAAAERDKHDKEMIQKLLGSIDPTDPKAAADLAARLTGQAGFNSVVYKGNGLYMVDYAISGQLAYDYAFPTIERMTNVVPFLVLNRRGNGEVRIDSPLMQQAALAMPGGNAAQFLAKIVAAKSGKTDQGEIPDFPVLNGHFTLTTDGVILSNNTEHGPKQVAGGKQLDWDISFQTAIAPMALVQLGK